ncbi:MULTISPECIES: GntR family transcriptional regulator [unclassified Streptomyces]|uniref:GntR family transcriptional regulator n=1 Tax=unclassified Streptomyces TaxID=2593676 RepID=UPI002237DDAD|nr:GntR family transcriptional regulator [Streptomyces sp. SHP 1-2]MCW5253176.1 FCD domain-containing protein [Streptomyces sp. SHP 1-2]
MTTPRSTTRAEDAYQQLRADILNGRHEPGSRLRVEVLKERYGVSSGVLREALPRLVGQGLATFAPQQGFRVVAVSPEHLRDLTEARVVIETHVVRESLAHGSIEWESDLLAAHHNLARTSYTDSTGEINERWLSAHARFHGTLLAGCPNRRLQAVATQLRESAEVYRCWAPATATGHSHRDVAAEHRLLCDRAIARDVPGTVEALTEHIELTSLLLLEGHRQETDGGTAP